MGCEAGQRSGAVGVIVCGIRLKFLVNSSETILIRGTEQQLREETIDL